MRVMHRDVGHARAAKPQRGSYEDVSRPVVTGIYAFRVYYNDAEACTPEGERSIEARGERASPTI